MVDPVARAAQRPASQRVSPKARGRGAVSVYLSLGSKAVSPPVTGATPHWRITESSPI